MPAGVVGLTALGTVILSSGMPAIAGTSSPSPTPTATPAPRASGPSIGPRQAPHAGSSQLPGVTDTVTTTATAAPTSTSSGPVDDVCEPELNFRQQQARGQAAEPDFGCGKLTVAVQPKTDTYPAGQLPDLANLQFTITDTTETSDPGTDTCTTAQDSDDPGATCPESNGPSSGEGSDNFPFATWNIGDSFTVTLSSPEPAHTLIPPITGTFPDCTGYAYPPDEIDHNAKPNGFEGPSGCPDTVTLTAYGLYRHIGLIVHNKVTHKLVKGATYSLCSPTAEAPVVGGPGCPIGSTSLASATTNSHGFLEFAGLYAGSTDYSVVPTKVPHGYGKPGSQRLEVPDVTTSAEAGSLFIGHALLPPLPPILRHIFGTTAEGTPITVNVFAGAIPVSSPLTLTGLGHPSDGTATDPKAKATYTPKAGFVGTDTFTYSARNRLGGVATAKVTIRVTRVKAATPPAPSTLPLTGAPIADEAGLGIWGLVMGGFLTVAGRRRRRRH
ncbi:MAG TPA: Ig-like domain-containing protein [Mycobacteriales bacterium]|nr:Ig-like domain-containing protein [Mycobacteriales bacterium]